MGIPPTTDKRAIKEAFAARSRECHPEEHPEEYQRLRQAYQQALDYAKGAAEPGVVWLWEPDGEKDGGNGEKDGENGSPMENGEQVVEGTSDFSYSEVETYILSGQEAAFFTDFNLLAGNPDLRNRNSCWRYFLRLPEYGGLWRDRDFRRRFVENICTLPGWEAGTLEYFEKWLLPFQEGMDRETESPAWKKARRRSRLPFSQPDIRRTRQEREEHYKIMTRLYDRGIYESLDTAGAMEAYLEYYLPYARADASRIGRIQLEGRRLRERPALQTVAFLLILLCIAGGLTVYCFQLGNGVTGTSPRQEKDGAADLGDDGAPGEVQTPDAGELAPEQKKELEELSGQRLDELQEVYEVLTGKAQWAVRSCTSYGRDGRKDGYQEYDREGNLLYEEEYSSGKLQKTYRYAYDGEGRQVMQSWRTEGEGSAPESYRWEWEYDGQGNCILYSQYEGEQLFYYEEREYDGEGRLLSAASHFLQEGSWETRTEQRYEYDALGHTTLQWFWDEYSEETWQYRYSYDGEGRVSEEERLLYREDAGDYILHSRMTYSYDERGNLTEEWQYYSDEGGSASSYYIVRTYDENDQCRSTQEFLGESRSGILQRESRWDAGGNLVFSRELGEDSGEFVTQYTYDTAGNPIQEIRARNGEAYGQTLHTYDGEGRMLREEIQYPDGDILLYSYRYDSMGRKVRKETKYNGEMRNAVTWEYDVFGNCLKEKHQEYRQEGDLFWNYTYEYEYWE